MALIERRKPYPSYTDYTKYKPHLRRDFAYSCVYCTIHENEWIGLRHFTVEHLKPQSKFPHLICEYENLLYACNLCNSFKHNDWPSDDPLTDGIGYLNPCVHDYEDHFTCDDTSAIVRGVTPAARYMVERLHLNRRHLVDLRVTRRRQEDVHEEALEQYDQILSLISQRLESSSLPAHTRHRLEEAESRLRSERDHEVARWETRLQPLYEPEDFR